MGSRLIRLNDDALVEIEVQGDQIDEISGGAAEKISSSLDKIKPVLTTTCKSIVSVWKELNTEVKMQQAEVELGLSFEGQGNVYITKAKAGANLKVKMIFTP